MVDLTNKDDEARGVFQEITTQEGAISYVTELIEQVETARSVTSALDQKVNLLVMGAVSQRVLDPSQSRDLQRAREKARDNLMIRYGRALGALATLMHCRKLTAEEYNLLANRAHGALMPRSVEAVGV